MDEDTSCKIYQFPLLAGSACYNTGKQDAKYSKVQCDLNRVMYECSTSGDNRACDNDIINLPIDWLKLNEKCANLGFSPLTDDELRGINMHIGAYKGLYDGPKSEDHSEFVDTNLCKHTTSSHTFRFMQWNRLMASIHQRCISHHHSLPADLLDTDLRINSKVKPPKILQKILKSGRILPNHNS